MSGTASMTQAQRWSMTAAILGSGMVFLDSTVVNLALPKIGKELPAHLVSQLEGQTYAVSGYLAILAALLILAGALADYYGRRRVFAIGLAGFGVSSILCGLAPTLDLFVLFRLLQGATGALLVPGSLAILTALFEGQARARAFGIWASATSALSLVGPLVGGLLVDTASWRIAFLINVPLVILALYATIRHMPETRAEGASGSFDWLGSAVAFVAVGGLAFGLIRGEQKQWQDPLAWASIAVGAVALVAFPILMARRPNPLVPLDLFRRRRFSTINLSTLLIYGALYTIALFQGLFLQNTIGYSATAAGVIGIPTGILLTVLSARVGAAAGRMGARPFLIVGPTLMALGMFWFARIPGTTEPWRLAPGDPSTWLPPASVLTDVLPYILLFGVGISLVVAPLTTTLMTSVPVSNAGLASAINNAISRIGQPLLSAVIFIVVSGSFYAAITAQVPGFDSNDPAQRALVQPLNPPHPDAPPELVSASKDASVDALHLAAAVCGVLLLGGAVANGIGLRPRPGEDDPSAAAASSAPGPVDAPGIG